MGELIDKKAGNNLKYIFSKYIFFDLCRAIFCFNSYRYNRSHLSFYLTLNYALCNTTKTGNVKIDSYNDFLLFCNEISPFHDGTFDDEIIPDFGEIKIAYNGKYYPVFLGTGHNFLFPFMQELEVIAREINCLEEIESVLIYVDSMVSLYKDIEPFNEANYDYKTLAVPSKKYYENVKEKYSELYLGIEKNKFFLNLVFDKNKPIEEIHFIKDNEFYPLFNPSIVIDSINILYKNYKNININKIANALVWDAITSNYDISPKHDKILSHVAILENKDDKKILGNLFFDYLIIDNETLLFLLNQDKYKRFDLNTIIPKAKNQFMSKNFYVIEPYEASICKLFDFSHMKKVCFLIYSNNIMLGQICNFIVNENFIHLNIYDLISIIYQSKSSSEIVEYFNGKDVHQMISSYNGYSSSFDAWLNQNKELSQGALKFDMFFTDVYLVEWNIFQRFIDLEKWYPFTTYDQMFSNPFAWELNEKQELGFRRLICNNVSGFGGCFRRIGESFLFLTFNMTFENDENLNIRSDAIRLIEELIERNMVIIEQELIDCHFYDFYGVQIAYMPFDYAEKVDNTGFLKKEREYVYSDSSIYNGKLLIRFAVNEEKLFNDILDSKDKRIECLFIEELLSCVDQKYRIDYDKIKSVIDTKKHNKKDIEIISLDLKYIFSNKNIGFWSEDDVFVQVRKSIAKNCKMSGIEPGIYSSKQATEIVRKIQGTIIPHFESIISNYDKIYMHEILLSNISYYLHEKRIETNRYSIVGNNLVSDEAKTTTGDIIIQSREQNKNRIKDIYYLIDTNLAIKHIGNKKPTYDEIKYLLAYSHWLIVLQESSDETHYNLFDSKIEIADDYRLSTLLSQDYTNSLYTRQKRIYDNIDFVPTTDNKTKMFHNALDSFFEDTGVHLDSIIQVCSYLAKEFSAVFKPQCIPDVYRIKRNDLISDYKSILLKQTEENISNFITALDYLTIDASKIKTVNGKATEFVPIWEREGRNHRFEVRPLLKVGDELIFSPVVMFELYQLWSLGTFDFYPPYEFGLKKYCKSLAEWKSSYEKQMENDIAEYFMSLRFKVTKNLQLHKLDKMYGHPKDLGDYDVIAIDMNNKVVWNIESKFLGRVGSIKEYYNHQDSFFNKDKKDEKYSKRIEYLSKHKVAILNALGIKNGEEFSINNFMITNKVFTSELKKIDFDIITFHELKQIIK